MSFSFTMTKFQLVHYQTMMMVLLLQMTKVEFKNSLRHMCLNM